MKDSRRSLYNFNLLKIGLLLLIIATTVYVYRMYAPVEAYKSNAIMSFAHENCDDIKNDIFSDKKITQSEYDGFLELCKDRREEIQTTVMNKIGKR